ncbi:hypothetical protein L7F22_006137 [Adiantum nelumboides]|nr:hypothetical protein [Adiantum nelumboides]
MLKQRASKQQITCIANTPGESLHHYLQKWTIEKDIAAGRLCYDRIVKTHFETLSFWGDQLIRLFAAGRMLSDSIKVFDGVLSPTLYTWNAIISAHMHVGDPHGAIRLYRGMQLNCVRPDRITFLCMLKACISLTDLLQGRIMYVLICEHGLGADHIIGNAVVHMFSKLGRLEEAHRVFNALIVQDRISWGALITGYVQQGFPRLALDLYENMQKAGVGHDRVILLCVSKAVSCLGVLTAGRVLHNDAVKDGFDLDTVLGSALIDMYAKCESMQEAGKLFDKLPKRNVVSWGALIGGFSSQGDHIMVCLLYERMEQEGIQADRVIFLCVLKAYGGLGALWQGRSIDDLLRRTCIDVDVVLGSTLVEMYVLCGSVEDAHKVVIDINSPNNILWGMLIGGYAICGNHVMVGKCLATMQQQGLTPDHMVFTQVLATCSHSGLLDIGFDCFSSIVANQRSVSSMELYTCIVDLFGRAGRLDAAANLIKAMPFCPDDVAQRSLLTGHKTHMNTGLD